MLEFFIQGKRMIFLFMFPFVGFIFDIYIVNQNIIKLLKAAAVIILVPLCFNFNFRIDYLDVFLILIFLSSFYSDYSKKLPKQKKGKRALLWTFLLFLVLGFWWFISSVAVTKKEKIYSHDSYSVYDHSDKGFSGGTAHQYELCHNALIPLYEKSIHTTRKVDDCYIHFTREISFDKCKSELIFHSTKNEGKSE